jgi:hypothetical protein
VSGTVELAAVIGQLREELTRAALAGEGEEFRFEVGPIELELTVAVAREAGPNAKVRFWVVELGADARLNSTNTQRIKLTLDLRRAGEPDRRPEISGLSRDGER